jgi:hypothetical protein
MLASRVVNMINLLFTIVFSTFVFLFVDWASLATCGESDSSSGCGNFSSYVTWDLYELESFTFWRAVVIFYFITFCMFWVWTFCSFFPVLKSVTEQRVLVVLLLPVSAAAGGRVKDSDAIGPVRLSATDAHKSWARLLLEPCYSQLMSHWLMSR